MGPEYDPYPDGPPIKLDKEVTFIPADKWHQAPGNLSQRVVQEAIVADFDDNGYLSLNGQRGLWHVRFSAELGWANMDIQVTAEHTQVQWMVRERQNKEINGVVFLFIGDIRCTKPNRVDEYALIPKEFYGPTNGNIDASIMSDASLDILGVFALRVGQYFMVNASKMFLYGSVFMTWPYTQ